MNPPEKHSYPPKKPSSGKPSYPAGKPSYPARKPSPGRPLKPPGRPIHPVAVPKAIGGKQIKEEKKSPMIIAERDYYMGSGKSPDHQELVNAGYYYDYSGILRGIRDGKF